MGEKLQSMVEEARTRANVEEAKVEGVCDIAKIKERYKEYI